MADIDEVAEKKFKSRMAKIRKSNREPEEKEKFSQKFGTSKIRIRTSLLME